MFLTDGTPQPRVGSWVEPGMASWSVMPELSSKGQNKCLPGETAIGRAL